MTSACLVPRTTGAFSSRNDLGPGREVLYMLGRGHRSSNKAGGNVLKSYDFGKNKWRIVDKKNGPGSRIFSAVVVYEECIWVIGGCIPDSGPTNSVVIYNPKTKKWNDGPSMEHERFSLRAVVVGGAIYAVGGTNKTGNLDQTESYRSNGSGWLEENPMRFPRSNFAIAARNQTIYALGGNSERSAINLSVESYPVDVVSRSWRLDDVAMNSPRRKPKAAVVDDQLYVLGGDDRNTVAVKDLRAVTSQPWVLISLLRFESWDFDVVAFERRLYVAATMIENVHRTIFEVFDTEIYEWTDLPPPAGKPIHSISAVIEKEYSRL